MMVPDEGRLIDEWTDGGQHVVIRSARWADLEDYGAMQRSLYHECVMASTRNVDLRAAGEMLGRWLTLAATGTGVLLVAEVDGKIVGEGTLQPSSGDGSITLGIMLCQGYRGQGIGRRLMLALEGQARALGKRRIDLTVWGANAAARHLYSSLGYAEIGRFPDWIRSDLAPGGVCDLVWMLKDL